MGIVIRKITFWVAVAAAVAVFIAIFVLTEQSPGDTTALSASVSDAIASRQADAVGAGAPGASSEASAVGEGAAGPVEAMLAIGNVRKWAHTAEFLAFGAPVALASALWWGRPRGARARVLAAAGVCVLASLFDQTHKIFVPGREFDAGDLLFDLLGYCTAIALVSLASMALKRILSVGRHVA
ncbi:VanZ family protein [Collinsella tanakaei]|uniref:VanZ family protein n=2 Tax=Coriobacteriia TaxID=84998 RepID=UPI0026F07E21|nr:VanZ family protein [Collinsella tanakaei]